MIESRVLSAVETILENITTPIRLLLLSAGHTVWIEYFVDSGTELLVGTAVVILLGVASCLVGD